MRYRVKRITPTVPTASMADIAFLLIIFFMLTTSFSPERTNVTLPESQIQTEVSEEAAIVAITVEGELHFSDGEAPSEPVDSVETLGQLARGLTSLAPRKEFLIKADRDVPYRVIDDVLDALRKNQVRFLGLLTRRKIVDSEEAQEVEGG